MQYVFRGLTRAHLLMRPHYNQVKRVHVQQQMQALLKTNKCCRALINTPEPHPVLVLRLRARMFPHPVVGIGVNSVVYVYDKCSPKNTSHCGQIIDCP